jgi:hypothetical protein
LRVQVGLVALAMVIGCLSFFGSAGAECIDYEDYLHWVGSVTSVTPRDVAVSGTHAYVAAYEDGFLVIDITNPASSQIVGSVDTPGSAYGVAVSGMHAYVADYSSGLQVIDITNPASPQIVGSVDTPGFAYGVAVSGMHAYVADYGSGLQVIDITNPASPQIVGSVDTPGSAQEVAVADTHAYVADDDFGLQVIDITNPVSPQIVGNVDPPGRVYDVAISGTLAYVAEGTYGHLVVIDITNPASPWVVGSVDTWEPARGVAVSGMHAHVAELWSCLQVIDITNPANPQIVGSVDKDGYGYGVTVSGTHAYLAAGGTPGRGLHVVDVTVPASVELVGRVDTPGTGWDVAVSETHAYVADYYSGLQVIDITNPASPWIVGSVDTPGSANGVTVSGVHAYIADYGSGLQVIDITNPASPQIVGSVDTPGRAHGVAVSGTYAYVADEGSGLQVIDITNPASPWLVGSVDTPGQAWDVEVSETHAYVADCSSGLHVIDITNPASPWLVGSVGVGVKPEALALAGTCVYATNVLGIVVVDVTNPASPQIVGSVGMPDVASGVAVRGTYAYIGVRESGLQVIDVTNPASPRIVGGGDTPGAGFGVAVSGTHVYVADYSQGLSVFPLQCGLSACEVSPTSVDFGELAVGDSAERSFEVWNAGEAQLTGLISESCEAYELVAGGGEFSLAGGESRSVTVRFEPLTPGSYPCTITTGTELCSDVSCLGTCVARLILSEPFAYPDGDLTVQSGFAWTTHSGSGTDIQVLEGVVIGDMNNSRDDNRLFPTPRGATDRTYASFKVLIPSLTETPGTNYFAHFRIGSGFPSKVWVTPSSSAFTLGVSVGGNSLVPPAGDIWPVSLQYDEWYTVATLYDAALGVSKLWVNPVQEESPSITATDAGWSGRLIESFALRQSNSAPPLWQFHIADLKVGGTFAGVVPSTADIWPQPTFTHLDLLPIVPNPARTSAAICFDLPTSGSVHLAIFDVTGRQVRHLWAANLPAGRHEFRWDGYAGNGLPAAAGTYFCRLMAGARSETRTMTLLRGR